MSKTPTRFKETSVADQYFRTDFEHLRQSGGDPSMIAALYPMLTSANATDRSAAEVFIRQHSGIGDPSNDADVAENVGYLREAQRMVSNRGYDPTPAAIRAEYAPNDAALNKSLDAASTPVREGRFAPLGVTPGNPHGVDLSASKGGRRTRTYSLGNDGKFHARSDIDL
jgi:hypothetical protein